MGARVTLVPFPGAGHLFLVTEHKKAAAAVVSFLHQQSISMSDGVGNTFGFVAYVYTLYDALLTQRINPKSDRAAT
jgi:hypothetical protein